MGAMEWNRRALLLASAGLASLGGCIGDGESTDQNDDADNTDTDNASSDADSVDDGADDGADTEDDGDEDPADAELAADHIEEARRVLQAAFDEMEERKDDEFDNAPFQTDLDTAIAELDEAETLATTEQEDGIVVLRNVVSYLRPWGNAESGFVEGFAMLEPGAEAYWAGREAFWMDDPTAEDYETAVTDFEDAVNEFDAAQTEFEDAAVALEESRTQLEELDHAILDDFDNADAEDHREHLEFAQNFAANMNFLAAGNGFGSHGWHLTAHAAMFVVQEDFEEALSIFQDAREPFDEVSSHYPIVDFQFLYDTAPFLEELLGVLICENERGVEMVDHFITAMEATIEGNEEEYQNEIQAGLDTPVECQ